MGWLIPLIEETEDVSFEHFKNKYLATSDVKNAKETFRKMRLLQKSIEDAYNNPIIYNDYSGRGLLSELWNFAKDLICEVGEAIEVLSPAYAGCEYLALADGPLPIGDLIGLAAQAGGVLSGLRRLSAGQDQRPRHKKMSRGAAHAKQCDTGGAHSAPPVCCGMEFRGSPSFAALPAEPANPPWNRSRSAAGRPCRCRARAPCGRAARAGPAPLPDNSCRG